MKVLKKLLLAVAAAFCIGVLLLIGAIVYGIPDHAFSIAVFRIGYAITPLKQSYLAFYSPQRRDVGGGYIPNEVDEFLCQRAENSADDAELAAIANFYSLQSGGRVGTCIYKTSEKTREELIGQLMANLSETDYEFQIVLVEELRRGESVGKGRLGPGTREIRRPMSPAEGQEWHAETLPIARTAYIDWWYSNLPWHEKKQIDPLKDSIVHMNECCG